jgi:hypothetical protein
MCNSIAQLSCISYIITMMSNFFSKVNLFGNIIFFLHIVVMHLLFPILAVWGVGVWVPEGFQYLFPVIVSLGIWFMSKSYRVLDKINPLQVLVLGALLFSYGLLGHSHEGHSHDSVEKSTDWILILGGLLLTVAQVWHFRLNPPHKNENCLFSDKAISN